MKRFASVIFVVFGFCVFCDVSGAPYEGLGRVREIATVIRDTPYPNEVSGQLICLSIAQRYSKIIHVVLLLLLFYFVP